MEIIIRDRDFTVKTWPYIYKKRVECLCYAERVFYFVSVVDDLVEFFFFFSPFLRTLLIIFQVDFMSFFIRHL